MKKISSQYDGIKIMADPAIHEDAFRLVSSYLKPPGRILDIAAGAGAFASRLRDAGYRVDANDIDVANWRASGMAKTAYDLNQALPQELLAREPYDLVVAIEIIEHLENPSKFLRDCRSLVKPDGYILLSTPNVTNAYSRIAFFVRAQFRWMTPHDYHESGHMTLLPHWLLELILSATGLKTIDRRFVGYRVPHGNSIKKIWVRSAQWLASLLMRRCDAGELSRNAIIYLVQQEPTSSSRGPRSG
ncbi:MAG: methyltransferase domain-containing protein [Planctomycetota bacterium]|jgi:2-polyprenyl-3-methyl-5-hydroxy-6-metoxy-1,4-benzoquinol methylase